ncbi:MAG: SGNH/GDSL hydrolase family protein [Clostridia bacterium]|nr:SGNH/GDSL hydrolase family protein [Clostridia bacterium]
MKLEGKKIAFLGDSITEGVGVKNVEKNRYDNVLKRECNLDKVYNYGIGGTRIAHQQKPSEKPRHDLCFCGRVYNVFKDADIVVVYGGINDYLHGDAPIGQFGDKTPATFYGGVWFLMNYLKTNFADKTIAFLTPARLNYYGIDGSKPSNREQKREDALPVIEYVKIIKQTAKVFDIPTFDMYENLGIDPTVLSDKETYTSDGLHFNDAGHKIIAKKLREFLESL